MAQSGRSRRRRSRSEWQALFERFEHSDLEVVQFCQAESVSKASFYRWRRVLAEEARQALAGSSLPASFLDAGSFEAPASHTGGWELELALGGGVVLRLRRG